MAAGRVVEIGGDGRHIQPFCTAKIGQMFRVAADLGKEWAAVQNAMGEFHRDYGQRHKIRTTRDEVQDRMQAALDAVAAATDPENKKEFEAVAAGWQRRLDGPLKDREFMELSAEPTWPEVLGAVVPKAFQDAEPLIVSVLGLVAIGNDDLYEADKQNRRDEAIRELGLELYYKSTPDEALELLNVGLEFFLGDTEVRRKRVGELRARFLEALGVGAGEATETETATATPEMTGGTGSTSETSSSSEPSTDSPAPTTGPETTSSTGSRTVTSAV